MDMYVCMRADLDLVVQQSVAMAGLVLRDATTPNPNDAAEYFQG